MKVLVFLFVAVFALTAGNELADDLQEFVDIAPADKIKTILLKHAADEEFTAITNYILFSEEFKDLMSEADVVPEYLKVLDYVEESGLDIYMYLNYIHQALGIKPIVPPNKFTRNKMSTRVTLKDICDEIREVMPKKEIAQLHDDKMVSSKVYKHFAERIAADEYSTLIDNFNKNQVIEKVLKTFLQHGIDIKDIVTFVYELFGFKPYDN